MADSNETILPIESDHANQDSLRLTPADIATMDR
jgi:hypothetical protein